MRYESFEIIVLAPVLLSELTNGENYLEAGGKPSTWFPPGGYRANTATERKRTNKKTNQQTKNRQKISQITRHIPILAGGWLEAWWIWGLMASWLGG